MKLCVKLVRSTIKRVENQKRVVKALGLRKMNQCVIHDDNPVIRGMIYKVRHLVEVTELPDDFVTNEPVAPKVEKPKVEVKKVEKPVVKPVEVAQPEAPKKPKATKKVETPEVEEKPKKTKKVAETPAEEAPKKPKAPKKKADETTGN